MTNDPRKLAKHAKYTVKAFKFRHHDKLTIFIIQLSVTSVFVCSITFYIRMCKK